MVIPRKLDPAFVSTDDLMAAANVGRRTIAAWTEMGLLPKPTKVSLGSPGGVFNRYPSWAVDRVRLIVEKRAAGFTYEEIEGMVDELDRKEGRPGKPAVRPRGSRRR